MHRWIPPLSLIHIYWVFSTENKELIRVDSTAIVRHTKIKATANPFLDEAYFQKRKFDKGMHRLTGKFKMIWKNQNGLCYHLSLIHISATESPLQLAVLLNVRAPSCVFIHPSTKGSVFYAVFDPHYFSPEPSQDPHQSLQLRTVTAEWKPFSKPLPTGSKAS